jgi:ABC-2 type transport system permease protein
MVGRIIRHEWRALSADATLWVIGLAFASAIAYGVFNGAQWVGFQRQALAAAVVEEAERYTRLQEEVDTLQRTGGKVSPFRDPRSASNAGGRMAPRYAALPPGPLAALAIGQSDLLPYYFKVSTDARENIIAATEIENPQRLLVGRFDLAFVLIYFYPILILALCYNMLSSEQEQGTLALALSQPVPLRTLATGKVALRAAVLVAVVVVATLAALLLGGVDLTAPGALARLVLWIAAVLGYGAVWFAIALYVASRGLGSAANATVLASVWLVLVVVLPAVFNLAAATFYPVPSRVEMVQAVRVASDDANAEGSKLLARYYDDHPELASGDAAQAMTDFNMVRVAVSDDVERRVRPVVEHYERQIAGQQALIDRLRFVSPAVLMQNALNDVAGTGVARHQAFMAQVDAYHRAWRRHFTPLILARTPVLDYRSLPTFSYAEEGTGTVGGRVALSLAGLIVPAAVIAWLAVARLARFPIVA